MPLYGTGYDSAGARRKKYGPAAQKAYERDERMERSAMKDKLSSQRKRTKAAAAARGASRKAGSSGMSAGTYGGARSAMLNVFAGR